MNHKRRKKYDELDAFSLKRIERGVVIQEVRIFNETPVNVRKCYDVLTRIIYLMANGERLPVRDATHIFFSVTKLFQTRDESLRRMVYIVLKDLSKFAEDTIIAVAVLTKDITHKNPLLRANSIRAIGSIIDPNLLNQIERYLKTSIVNKDSYVASSALVTAYHLFDSCPDVIRRWISEIQEASKSRQSAQYHALGLLYRIREHDPIAVIKLVHYFIKVPSKTSLTHCILLRVSGRILANQRPEKRDKVLFDYIYGCLKNGGEIAIFEAARQLIQIPGLTAAEIEPAASALQIFLSSPKQTSRFAAIKTISKVALMHPQAIKANCITEMENLLTDKNKFTSTLAATTLLHVAKEVMIDKLLRQVTCFVDELPDDFKVQVIQSIKKLVPRYPAKSPLIMTALSRILKRDGGLEYKRLIVETFVDIIQLEPSNTEKALNHLSEFIEDCEYTQLSTRILHLLGEEGPKTSHPMTYIRSIYNRMTLETGPVRESAVNALAKYIPIEPVIVNRLLSQCMLDNDDQVRDKTTFYVELLNERQQNDDFEMTTLLNPTIDVPLENLEQSLKEFIENEEEGAFDIGRVSKEKVIIEQPQTTTMKTKKGRSIAEPTFALPDVQSLFKELGKLLKSSKVIKLTEDEAEYQVALVKHIFPEHVLLEFRIINSLEDYAIQNVSLEIEPTVDGWEIDRTLPHTEVIMPHDSGTTYIILPIPMEDLPRSKFNSTMKFEMLELDTDTHEVIADSAFADEYPVDDFIL